MQFLLFTKALAELSLDDMAGLAASLNVDGFDLCIRQGHHVQPQDVLETLPKAADFLHTKGLRVGMVSGPANFTDPDSPLAHSLCTAMARAGVPLLKLGYFPFNPQKHAYLPTLDDARSKLARWAQLAQSHKIKVCYHSHINQLGSSAGVLAQMLADLSPDHVAAYLDPAQLLLQGEGFSAGMAILQGKVAAIGFKDVMITRQSLPTHGGRASQWVFPGQGMVDWSQAAQAIHRAGFDGVISAHILMHQLTNPSAGPLPEAAGEVAFYRQILKETPL